MKKRMLSILLCLCMVVSLLPTIVLASGNTITPTSNTLEGLRNAFNTAQNGDTIQLTGDILTESTFLTYITINKAVTLDFDRYTVNFKGVGPNNSTLSGLFYLSSGASLTLKGSGGVTLSGDYSSLVQLDAGSKVIVESGTYTNSAATDGYLFLSYGGALEIKGGALSAKSYYTLALSNGTLNISGGTVTNDGTYALVSNGAAVAISGGTISSSASGTVFVASGGSVNMTGGAISNTGSGFALYLQDSAKASTLSGGTVSAVNSFAAASYAELSVAGGAVISSDSGDGLHTGGSLMLTGGSITSKSGIALVNVGSMTMGGGTIHSGSGYAFLNEAPSGKSATVTGGSLSSDTGLVAVNYIDSDLNISGGSFTTTGGACAVFNNAAGTVNITGGTLSAKTVTIVNNGAGTVKLSSGTIVSIANYKASGSIIIDGGSVKIIQGATPKNSAGTALREYPIQITGKQNTPIADGELTLTPAVTYSFAGVTTDASGLIYLWLPANETGAVYKTGSEEALNGGLAGAGKTTTLPNFTAAVTVYINDEVWSQNPRLILLSAKSTSIFGSAAEDAILPDGNAVNGVYTFSNLDESKTYYIWAPDVIGYSCIGTASANVLTKSNLSARVDYYNITLASGDGIAYSNVYFGTLLKGSSTGLSAAVNDGYKFKNWLYTGTSNVFSTNSDATVTDISTPLNLTAVGELNVYNATVKVNRDNSAWTDTTKAITLSTSKDSKDTNKQTGTATGATFSFTSLDPRVTYYVWADNVCTGQTITSSNATVTLDYYTVTVAAGANIAGVTINNSGSSLTVLKGGSAAIAATASAGDYVFSRWNVTADGSLYSNTATTDISNITMPLDLTAVGASTTYTATVTVNKDKTSWTSPHKIVLSTSQTECGDVVGTLNNDVYTFSKLPGANIYYVWDADTVTYTGKTISAGGSTSNVTLDYYSVTVTNSDTNITSVTGGGVYIEGSTVTVTATPVQYYIVKWNDNSTAGTKTLFNLYAQTDLSVSAELDVYTGAVTVQKDADTWTDFSGTVTLSTDIGSSATGKVSGSNTSGVISFNNLDPRETYYVWADGVYSGQILQVKAATVQYYTVSVTANGVASIDDQTVLAGKDASFTAFPNGSSDFLGWYDAGGKLLSTSTAFTLSGVTKVTALTAKASGTFDAVITVNGASGRIITLQSGSDSALSSFTGLDRSKTYKVLDNGIDTGFTVSKNAPNVTLQYYIVTLTNGTGITNVTGGGTFLAGSSVTIIATVNSTYVFSGWSGTDNISASKYTIPAISKNYTINATAALSFSGTADISIGSIVIEDDPDHAGKIRVTVGGTVPSGGGNLDPNTNITITGTGAAPSNILITATKDVSLTLKDLTVYSGAADGSGAGLPLRSTQSGTTVTLNLKGANYLIGILNKNFAVEGIRISGNLVIMGDGSLTSNAYGTYYQPGIRAYGNITINGGTITANSDDDGSTSIDSQGTITINGGCISANARMSSSNVIINGGSITDAYIGGTVDPSNGWVSTNNCSVTINGGNIKADDIINPINASGVTVTKQEYDSLPGSIYDSEGKAYGMNDVVLIGGKMYAWFDQTQYYTVTVPGSVTVDGVTAAVSLDKTKASNGTTVTATVTLSGTALEKGTYTVGLTGSTAGTITPPSTVTKAVAVGDSPTENYTFAFNMPTNAVSDLAVTLDFAKADKYALTYSAPDATGGSIPTGGSYYVGQTYTVDSSTVKPSKTGYTFAGWSTDGTAQITGSKTMGSANVTLIPVWHTDTYTVSFYSNGGSGSMAAQQFTYGAAAAALTQNGFMRIGYTFAGWAAASGSAKVYNDKDSITLTKSTDLYALWTPKTYTVSFKNGGGDGTADSQSFSYDTAQDLSPNAFTRAGYTFAGWKDTYGVSYKNGASYKTTSDTDLTAQWTPITFGVTFDSNGGTGSIASQSFTYDIAQNLTSNTSSITRTGYTFTGWNTKSDGNGTSYVGSASVSNLTAVNGASVTLYAVWQANKYTMSFNSNDGVGSMSAQQFTYDSAAAALTQNSFTRVGYAFAGWNAAKNGSGTSYSDKASVKNLSADKDGTLTLYAQWSAEVYSLTFSSNGGTGSMDVKQFASNSTETVGVCDFTKAGYTFTGWNAQSDGNGTSYDTDAILNTLDNIQNKAATLYAHWSANAYTVAFNSNGGTGSIGSQSFTYDVVQNLTANNSITRDGYLFLGWSDTPTASAATYCDNQSVKNLTAMKDGNVNLYAVWQLNTYFVTFIANGGDGSMEDLSITNGQSKVLSNNVFTRDGYKFSGWNTSADGSGNCIPDGAAVCFIPGSSGIVTLYAMWTEAVRYNISGTVKDDTTPTPVAISGAAVALRKGNTVIASTKTNDSGEYKLINILPGLYNLVITKDSKVITELITVAKADVTEDVILPGATTTNSVLIVEGDTGETLPNVVVGVLDTLAQAENANITMTVTARAGDQSNAQQAAIKTAVGSQKLGQFLEITLKMGSTDIGSTNSTVLEIAQPYSFSGKTGVTVWRYHGSKAEKLKQLPDKPVAPFEDGTYYADSQNGMIYIYAAKFSTYAVSYQELIANSAAYTVMVNSSVSGTVKTDKTIAAPGAAVTLTVTPNAGYTTKSLSVADASGRSIDYTDNLNSTFTFTMPNSNVTVSAEFLKQFKNPFIDVADNAYYYDAVLWAVEKGVTNGTGANTFSPDIICTRAQTVTFLWRAMGSPEPTVTSSPFTDVKKDAYYCKAVLWATEKGITIGTSSTTFSPNDTVTRGQAVTILWRTAGKSAVSAANPFGDVSSDAYYANAVLWAVSNGITTGTYKTSFSPADGCTRAQIATFLYRYLS